MKKFAIKIKTSACTTFLYALARSAKAASELIETPDEEPHGLTVMEIK